MVVEGENRWTFLEHAGKNKHGRSVGKFKCTCGTIRVLNISSVKCGYTRSCGCLSKEVSKKVHSTHTMSGSRIYKIYYNMLVRCNDKNSNAYPDYGGRGIEVCTRWLNSFENFYKDMGEGYKDNLTLERINPNGGYSEQNCTWVSKSDQSRNSTKRADNSSGGVGVHYSEIKEAYIAQWCDLDGKRKSKTFSVKKFGETLALAYAREWRKNAIEQLKLQGVNYSEYHGEDKGTIKTNKS